MTGSDYDPFAWLYNKYWGGEFIGAVLPVLDRYVFDRLPPEAHVLDLACGTGQLAALLSERGLKVTGVDGSEEMLQFARGNAPHAEFLAADARGLKLPKEFSAAVSTYDSLNHMMELNDLKQVFSNVYTALMGKGIFMFDLNMQRGYEARWNGTFSMVDSDHVAVIRSSFEDSNQIGTVEITIFRLMDEIWLRSDVTLVQRCYAESEVVSSLSDAGFGEIQILDAESDLGLAGQIGRSFFVATVS